MDTDNAWLPAILRDFEGTPAATVDVRLLDLDRDRPEALNGVIADPASWIDVGEPSEHRLLLAIGRNVCGLDPAEESGAVAVEIASRLQDLVMDETVTCWPTVIVQGRSVVLEPRLGPSGEPRWEGKDGSHCAFGELGERLAAGDR